MDWYAVRRQGRPQWHRRMDASNVEHHHRYNFGGVAGSPRKPSHGGGGARHHAVHGESMARRGPPEQLPPPPACVRKRCCGTHILRQAVARDVRRSRAQQPSRPRYTRERSGGSVRESRHGRELCVLKILLAYGRRGARARRGSAHHRRRMIGATNLHKLVSLGSRAAAVRPRRKTPPAMRLIRAVKHRSYGA